MAVACLKTVLLGIAPVDAQWREKVQSRVDRLAIPRGSLGRMSELSVQLGSVQESMTPVFDKKEVFVMAGDHGVVEEGVSTCAKAVTQEMVRNFLKGGAAVNTFAQNAGAKVTVVDMGIDGDMHEFYDNDHFLDRKVGMGTKNMLHEPAMTRAEAEKAIDIGIDLVCDAVKERGVNLIATGDMGIGNTTASSAILAAMTGLPAKTVTGRGTGLTPEGVEHKAKVIEKTLLRHRCAPKDALGILSLVGGYEIAGITGLILGAAYCRIPVIVDGYISTAGALLAYNLQPNVKDYMIFAHASDEAAHRNMVEFMGAEPLLHLNLRLGEGSGAALVMPMIDAAALMLKKMLTFDEADVTPGDN